MSFRQFRRILCNTTLAAATAAAIAADATGTPPPDAPLAAPASQRMEVEATFVTDGATDAAPKLIEGPFVDEDEVFDESSLLGLLPNDPCSGATVIPGNVTTYNPATYSTVSADVETCENLESCEINGVGVSNSVWYVYTPDADGQVEINTDGSTYNTVLSVWSSCRIQIGELCLSNSTQIACNDNAPEFGNPTWSRIILDVEAASAYCDGEVLSLRAEKDHVVLEFVSQDEEGDGWTEGEHWMPSLISRESALPPVLMTSRQGPPQWWRAIGSHSLLKTGDPDEPCSVSAT